MLCRKSALSPPNQDGAETPAYVYSHYFLGRRATALARIDLLNKLSQILMSPSIHMPTVKIYFQLLFMVEKSTTMIQCQLYFSIVNQPEYYTQNNPDRYSAACMGYSWLQWISSHQLPAGIV